jgi:hypothetical protein
MNVPSKATFKANPNAANDIALRTKPAFILSSLQQLTQHWSGDQ